MNNSATSTLVSKLTRVSGEMETRLFFNSSFILSVVQIGMVAGATAFFIKWWALAWFVVMVAMNYHGMKNHKFREGVAGAISIAQGATLYTSVWAAAWIVGGAEAAFLAGSMLGTQAIYSTAFFSSSRLNFLANFGPSLLVAVTAPFLLYSHPIPVLLILACVLQNFLAAMIARVNRNHMLEEVLRIQSEMEAARDTSLAKSQFIATMSHELRTPLNAVIGYAEILEEDLTEDGRRENASDAARIHRSARNLLSMINAILDFSKIEAGRLELHIDEVDVGELVDEVTQTVASITTAHATKVSMEIAPEARSVVTDGARLRQCLLNLMSNAAKFTDGGQIQIRATKEDGGAGGEMLRIDVVDTGRGISAADAARLFQPFTQVDGSLTRKEDGTGLGLVITRRLSELLGGEVSLVSAENAGSTFTLRVRDYAHKNAAAHDHPLVFLIEHDASALDFLRRAVEHLPIKIAEARTAAAALALTQARVPDLIVLDLHLPDSSGWDLLAEFKADDALRNVPVLVMSFDEDRARALRLGACDHLVKPVDSERFASAMLRFARAPAPTTQLPSVAAA